MGASSSTAKSEQQAEATIAQQFSGSCNVTCTNIQSNTSIDLINSIIGGDINLTQSCSVDANCSISSSSDAVTDIMFKADNSTNAKDAGPFSSDTADSESRQNMKQKVLQKTTETCEMSSLNEMRDVSILAVNSQIAGSININQSGSTKGSCQLQNNMSAAATATAMASNTAKSGKDKKKSDKKSTMAQIFGFIAVMVVVYFISKMYTGSRDTGKMTDAMKTVAMARAEAGCPGGKSPVLNHKTGLPVIDPKTLGPVCPPMDPISNAPVINIDMGGILNKAKQNV